MPIFFTISWGAPLIVVRTHGQNFVPFQKATCNVLPPLKLFEIAGWPIRPSIYNIQVPHASPLCSTHRVFFKPILYSICIFQFFLFFFQFLGILAFCALIPREHPFATRPLCGWKLFYVCPTSVVL